MRQLARIESERLARGLSVWLVFIGSMVFAITSAMVEEDWSGQKYAALIPLAMVPMLIGVYVAGVRAGNRDRSVHLSPLAEEAPLDGDDRVVARLVSLAVPVALIVPIVAVVGVGSRIEGGYWVGDWPNRTDSAVHSVFELIQPLLAVAVVGAAGVAIGRAIRRAGPAIALGMLVLFLGSGVYWVWNASPIYPAALLQVHPLENEFSVEVVHQPTIVLHDLYLVGLLACCCGLAVRRHRWPLVLGGMGIAVLTIAAQLAITPV
jgi:hypothetical protein